MKRINSDLAINENKKDNFFPNIGKMLIDFSVDKNVSKNRNRSLKNFKSETYNSTHNIHVINNNDIFNLQENKKAIDKRYNNLKYNLIPKNSRNKSPLTDIYFSRQKDNLKNTELYSNRVYSNPKKLKSKVDGLDNYNIPEKLKKEVKSIDEMDNYNYNFSLTNTSPILNKNMSRNKSERKNYFNRLENPNGLERKKKNEIDPGGNQNLYKNKTNKIKSLSPKLKKKQKYLTNNFVNDSINNTNIKINKDEEINSEEELNNKNDYKILKKKFENINSKEFGNLEENEKGLDGGENPIGGEDINGNIYKKKKGRK
jgi:hypothetical protein